MARSGIGDGGGGENGEDLEIRIGEVRSGAGEGMRTKEPNSAAIL